MTPLITSQGTVNKALVDFLAQKRGAAEHIHPSYKRLLDEVERVVFAGGKRLRPHLIFLGYGGYNDTIAKVAAAHEMLHIATLMHDDIIDRDDIRHNAPTIHHAYEIAHYEGLELDPADRRHFSMSAAILAGDLLISSAYALLGQAGLNEEDHRKAVHFISTGVFEVIGGELLDTEAPFLTGDFDPMTVYRYKTAGYSFIAPLLTGAALSHRYSENEMEDLREYATSLGIAFQIQDDTLGVFGESEATGKSTTGDLREGKQTLLIAEFKRRANEEQLSFFKQTFGQSNATDEDLLRLKEMLKESGALQAALATEKSHTNKAAAAAQRINNEELQQNLLGLIDKLNGRNA